MKLKELNGVKMEDRKEAQEWKGMNKERIRRKKDKRKQRTVRKQPRTEMEKKKRMRERK